MGAVKPTCAALTVSAFVQIRPDFRVANLPNVFIIYHSPAHAALPSNRYLYGKKYIAGGGCTMDSAIFKCLPELLFWIKSNSELLAGAWLK